jgi:hypothetical protein
LVGKKLAVLFIIMIFQGRKGLSRRMPGPVFLAAGIEFSQEGGIGTQERYLSAEIV